MGALHDFKNKKQRSNPRLLHVVLTAGAVCGGISIKGCDLLLDHANPLLCRVFPLTERPVKLVGRIRLVLRVVERIEERMR